LVSKFVGGASRAAFILGQTDRMKTRRGKDFKPAAIWQGDEVAIIGRACRLPGARSSAELWEVLASGRCTVATIPLDRWPHQRFLHPRPKERGRSYTFAAGILDDVWGFDPGPFGISPREAEQMDPQQRLLLELSWEALEDAGIRPSSLAGSETGVFVGGSALDYGNLRLHDPAGADPYFATGNNLAILSNRISYIFDLHGPSFTIDTACSSSLVALDAAVGAIQSGKIDTAIVGGVNILVSPFGFISFSQATMLSQRGLCQAFSAKADGYVRSEGGGVLILRALRAAKAAGDRIYAAIAGSEINSDGRTSGISLPSRAYQAALLERAYSKSGIGPEAVAFVEAHGTGTRAGDPVEAAAIGEVLGRRRASPLPIGSIKTNIGHTEPASGLAGVFKAMLALEHDELPRSLHFDEPNPDIPFSELNVTVCAAPLPLPRERRRYAGVSSLGFGGTNAHVILADPPACKLRSKSSRPPSFLLLTAKTREALAELARQYSRTLAQVPAREAARIAAATGHRRELHSERLALPFGDPAAACAALDQAAEALDGGGHEELLAAVTGTAIERASPVAFVFSGNGSQWPGMGRAAYETNPVFRAEFDKIDRYFRTLAGWALSEAMFDPALRRRLAKTSIAQPLIFAIQAAAVRCLARLGISPSIVLGHSMGEIAAAEAAGILDLESAVRVVYFRSLRQEICHGAGSMAVVFGPRESAEALVEQVPGLSLAAHNSPRSFTIAGSKAALDQASKLSRALKAHLRQLDLAYPFHSALMAPVEAPLVADLKELRPASSRLAFFSTVEGRELTGREIDGHYWWRNVREPVRFMETVALALNKGVRVFIEIGPSPVLLSDVRKIAEQTNLPTAAIAVLEQKQTTGDPFEHAAAQALALGAKVDSGCVFGDDPGPVANLPAYPWQRKPYRLADTPESTGWMGARPWHPLTGARLSPDALEWRTQLDPVLVPALADHSIDGQVLLPGAAFAEMVLATAGDWLDSRTAAVKDLEILQPMVFPPNTSREAMCRVTPATSTIEVMSRARLSDTPWTVHAKAKVALRPGPPAELPCLPPLEGEKIPAEALYAAARRCGLEFGPAFRQVLSACRIDPATIAVQLVPGEETREYGLDPARLDACFHGLISLFPELGENGTAAAYLPVRFGEIRLERPGEPIAVARIDVRRRDPRVIVADFALFGRDGMLIALLKGARYQALRREAAKAANQILVQTLALASEPAAGRRDSRPLLKPLRAVVPAEAEDQDLPADFVLIEGWATAAVYRLACALAENGVVAPYRLAKPLPENRRGWLAALLTALEKCGLLRSEGGEFVLSDSVSLPDPNRILRSLAAEHPDRPAELLLAARAGSLLESLGEGQDAPPLIADSTLDAFETGSAFAAAGAAFLACMLESASGSWPKDRALRILQIGSGPLTSRLSALAQKTGAQLSIFDPKPSRLERARLSFANVPGLRFAASLDEIEPGSADLLVASQSLSRLLASEESLVKAVEALGPAGLLLAIEPAPSLFWELLSGLTQPVAAQPDPAVLGCTGWASRFAATPAAEVEARPVNTAAGPAVLITGEMPASPRRPAPAAKVTIWTGGSERTAEAEALSGIFEAEGAECSLAAGDELESLGSAEAIAVLPPVKIAGESSAAYLARRCLALRDMALKLGKQKRQIWIVCPGAVRPGPKGVDPAQAGVWAFTRTLANEFPSLDVRRLDVDSGLPPLAKAQRIASTILSGSAETELVLDADATRVVRLLPRNALESKTEVQAGAAARLEKGQGAGLDRIRWAPATRHAPGPGQVEIEVAATGLNFRDVMWGLSVLPDEMLEGGLAGPTLGLECAGRIAATGDGVADLKPGDAVVAIAGGAFATHLTVESSMVAKLPEGLSLEAAATIPVTFLTAYYALISCARLEAGEWILVHGGAGGVGLAALQIARWRGARVIATASTPEKRDLCITLGAEHAFDARGNAFVEDVRRVTGGEGVAVVLNSLSGEAMELSISLLKPFGRFVELGKRDFLANTHIGLRPFRNNLSYFGVDLDQLMLIEPKQSRKIFKEVLTLISEGELHPLPYRRFEAHETIDAMRLMQQSGHIGKIIVKPPDPASVGVAVRRPFIPSPDKAHLITGGCGGFGLATAKWLAGRGARHLVLVGRSGAAGSEAQQALAELSAAGVSVHAKALDITNALAARKLFERFGRDLPPLAGVIHAAAILEDAVIANLDSERIGKVLAPKAGGAEILDRLTRGIQLDYFVLFSSATTALGNPGQANYVAANGFLEGLARQRRSLGLPALAVAWGGIEDTGLLARNRAVKDMLAGRAGVKTMAAVEALDLMAEALAGQGPSPEEAVVIISEMNWAVARAHLPLLHAPAYAILTRNAESGAAENRAKLDIRKLLAVRPPEEARGEVAGAILEEIAHILRLPKDKVIKTKPLADIGVDSLMAVELAAALEERLALETPLTASASGFNVEELADHIIGLCISPASEDASLKHGLAERHLGKGIDSATLESLTAMVEEKSRDLTQILR